MTTATSSTSPAGGAAAPASGGSPAPGGTSAATPPAPDLSTLPMSARVSLAAEGVNAARQASAADKGTATPEPKPPEGTPAKPSAEELKARRFAAAAKQEQELQTKRAALEKEAAELTAWKKEQTELAALKEKDPIAYLERLGLKYEDLTERVLSRKEPSEADKALEAERQRVAELAKKVEDLEKQREDERRRASEQAERDYFAAGETALEAQKADFSLLLSEDGGKAMVREYLEGYASKTGKVLPYLDACRHVQSALEERYAKVLQTDWAKRTIAPASPERAAPQATSESGQRSPRTITNAHAGEVRTYTPDELAKMPMQERMAIAAAGVGRRG